MKLRNLVYLSLIILLLPFTAMGVGMSGGTYRIPFDSLNIGGDDFATSASYRLLDTVGENAPGFSSGSSYAMNMAGYRQSTGLILILSMNNLVIGNIQQNQNASGQIIATVTTDAGNGYNLFIKENQPLTSGVNTIPDFGGTIAVPIPWVGNAFGFTLSSGTGLHPKWGGGTNYAGIPAASTLIHPKAGYSSVADNTDVDFYVNVGAQPYGSYSNIVTFTALPKL